MTIEKAITILQDMIPYGYNIPSEQVSQAKDAVIKAVKDGELKPIIYGEWIPDDYGYYHCSECGCEMEEREFITPYCPKCGAKMED